MSLTQSIHRGLQMYPDRPALVSGEERISYGELHERVSRCAAVFASLDDRPQSRVGILTVNSSGAIQSFYGALWAGMVPNYLNIRWSAFELSGSIDDFEPSILVVDDLFLDMGLELVERCECIRSLVYLGTRDDLPAGVLSYSALLSTVTPMGDHCGGIDEMAFLNYTGGTTGKGKGVIHSHATHLAGMNMAIAEELLTRGRALLAVPLFHISGIAISNTGLMLGNTLYILPAFDPLAALALIMKERIEQALLVPTMWQMLLHHSQFADFDLGSLRHVRYGASPIDESLLLELREKLPGADFMQVYGQTEGVPATFLHDCDHRDRGVELGRTRSAGRACFGVELEIRDPEGRKLPAGEPGEIALRGPHLMLGYLNNPEQTAEALQGDWLVTGDAGYLSEDGYLYVVDRIKDMIISGGENVYSVEVENALYEHKGIEHCALVGLPDEKWGERVHAEVVLKPDAALSDEDLIEHCRQFLAGYKIPKSVAFVEALPLTAVGKVDKVAIRNKYAEEN